MPTFVNKNGPRGQRKHFICVMCVRSHSRCRLCKLLHKISPDMRLSGKKKSTDTTVDNVPNDTASQKADLSERVDSDSIRI